MTSIIVLLSVCLLYKLRNCCWNKTNFEGSYTLLKTNDRYTGYRNERNRKQLIFFPVLIGFIGYFFGRWCLSCRTGGGIDIEGGGEAMPMRRTFNGFQDKRS